MGRVKDFLTEYESDYGEVFDERDLQKIENKILKWYIEKMIHECSQPMNMELRNFLGEVLQEHLDCYFWIMVSDNTNTANFSYDNLDEMTQALTVLSTMKYNVYYSPAVFSGWRIDEEAQYYNSVFIDIDDVDNTDFSEMTTGQIREWLMKTYDLPKEELLPNICVASGHGLHLYYLVDELCMRDAEQEARRDLYTKYLITYFKADVACKNKSRILRVPGSYNVKHEERKTRLHWVNESGNRNISRLDFFRASNEEIEEYLRQSQEIKNAKAKATRERNRKEREANGEVCPREKKKKASRAVPKAPKENSYSGQLVHPKEGGFTFYTTFYPHQRYWNIIKDLHNFYVRNNGNLYKRRNLFITILSTYLKQVMSLEDALEFVEKYLSPDFEEEGVQTVIRIYEREKEYQYRNTTIAELLCFSQRDIKESYCNFSEERIEQARKEALQRSNRKLAERRKKQRCVAEYKDIMYDCLKTSDKKVKDLAIIWGVSESTIKRMRRKIRNEKLKE